MIQLVLIYVLAFLFIYFIFHHVKNKYVSVPVEEMPFIYNENLDNNIQPNSPRYKKLVVPRGALKATSEKYNKYNIRSASYPGNLQYPDQSSYPEEFYYDNINPSLPKDKFYDKYVTPALLDQPQFYMPPTANMISSVNRYVPLKEVNTPYETIGRLRSNDENNHKILRLRRRPIAPLQDLYEYDVYDAKNKLHIPLRGVSGYLVDGDVIPASTLKSEGNADWTAEIDKENKYVYV